MKVLVLGGTGAMGSHLVDLLTNNGVETVVTSRESRCSERNIRYIQGNAHGEEFLQIILREPWDAIVDFMVYTTSTFEKRVNLFLDATSQYIFLSTARVYADSDVPITEVSSRLLDASLDKEFLETDEYSLTKARQENILKSSGRTNWTVIRPYITYSEKRLQLGVLEKEEWLYRALKGRTIVFSSDINSKLTTMTYGRDVAKGIMGIIGNPATFGEIYHITVEEQMTWNEILSIYLAALEKYLGQRPKVLLQDLKTFMEFKPAKYQIMYDRMFNRRFDNSKISRYVEIKKLRLINEGLNHCIESFLKDPKFDSINWTQEALKDRQTNERASLKEIPGLKQKFRYLMIRYFNCFL